MMILYVWGILVGVYNPEFCFYFQEIRTIYLHSKAWFFLFYFRNWKTSRTVFIYISILRDKSEQCIWNSSIYSFRASLVAQMVRNLPATRETEVWSMGWEDFPGEGNGNPLQDSCLENPRDWGAWWAAVHEVAKSRTWLSD